MNNDTPLTPAQLAGIEALKSETAYSIADAAEYGSDNDEARSFWESIRDGLIEAIEYADGDADAVERGDALSEIADGAPDVYNYTRMLEAIGTRAYLARCDIGCSEHADMVEFAGHVLYEAARAALDVLLTVYRSTVDDFDDDENDDDTPCACGEGADTATADHWTGCPLYVANA